MGSESGKKNVYKRSGPSPTARDGFPKQNKRRNGHFMTVCGTSLAHLYFFNIELTHPRAGVTIWRRRFNFVGPGRQKGESEECKNNELFHG
jgi:hypothetical protein